MKHQTSSAILEMAAGWQDAQGHGWAQWRDGWHGWDEWRGSGGEGWRHPWHWQEHQRWGDNAAVAAEEQATQNDWHVGWGHPQPAAVAADTQDEYARAAGEWPPNNDGAATNDDNAAVAAMSRPPGLEERDAAPDFTINYGQADPNVVYEEGTTRAVLHDALLALLVEKPATQVYDIAFFRKVEVRDTYKQHNAALKYFRGELECHQWTGPLFFIETEPVRIAAIVHPKGMEYGFDYKTVRHWSWVDMIAQLDERSMREVVLGPSGRSGGLVGCRFEQRLNSYDHKRHHALKSAGQKIQTKLRCWDFVVLRADGSAMRIHPQWSSTKIDVFYLDGHDHDVEPPASGLGESSGRGTYRRYKELGVQGVVRFDAKQK